jgi:hypothetical protein
MAATTAVAAVAAASLYAGIRTGTTQGVLSGDKNKVQAGLGQVAQGNLSKPAGAKSVLGLAEPIKQATPLPNANSDSVNKSKLNTLFNLQNRSGRASTLLTTATTDKFGG